MKVSEVRVEELANYLKLDYTDMTADEKREIETLLTVAKEYVKSYTGLTSEQIDTHNEFVIVVYILVQDMHDNRKLYVDKNNMNKVIDTILGMHSVNLL